MNIDFKVGHQRERSFSETEPRVMRHHTWAAIVVGVAGVGTSLYGANKQNKAQQAAVAQNNASQDKNNASAWASYLLSRGVNPNGVATGEIPINPTAVNSRLPLWANVQRTRGASPGFRLSGAGGSARLAPSSPAGAMPVAAPIAQSVSAPAASSRNNDLLIGNPLGIGGKNRNFLDPLGIF